jgi:hypothetical protein
MENQNPLKKHFRRPAIHIRLPSKGKFWKDGDLELNVTGDIPVYPMTTADEITLKTPDGLMSGESVVNVIQSCCPSIKNAWGMPGVDVDALLIAIRIASYGTDMELHTVCPHCEAKNDYTFNLSHINDGIKCPDFAKTLNLDGLEIKLRPLSYFEMTQTNIKSYEEQRMMDAIKDANLSEEERNVQVKASLTRIMEANELALLNSTESIKTDDGQLVTDKEFIKEYYKNASGKTVAAVKDRLNQLAAEGALPKSTIKCVECKKDFTTPMTFDYSSFFGLSS